MRGKIKNCLKVIFSTAMIVSVYGILEHFGIDKHIWVQDVQNRVFSTLGQPNWLAAYLLTLIPLTLAFNQFSYYLLTAIFYLTLLYTKSRSGLAGLAIAYLTFWGFTLLKTKLKKFPIKKFILASTLLGLISLISGTPYTPSLKTLLNSKPSLTSQTPSPQPQAGPPAITLGGSESSDIRQVVWQGAIDIWRQYPLLGSGVETFAYSYYNHRPTEHNLLSEWDFLYNKAHNEFLNFLATTGALGLTSYCLIILYFTLWTFKQKHSLLLTSLIAGFLGLAVSNFFGFSVVPVALFFFLWPALALDSTRGLKSPSPSQKKYPLLANTDYLLITLIIFSSFFLIYQLINWWRADFHYSRGKNYAQLNQLQDSFNYLNQAVSLMPSEPVFRSDLAEVQAKLAVTYHQQLEVQPSELHQQIITARDQLISQALANTNLVLQQNPVHLNFWKNHIQTLLLLYTIDPQYQLQSIEAFQQAIKLSPTDPKLRYNFGLLYHQLGQTGLAEQIITEAINLKPNYEAARYNLGLLYQQTNRPELAKDQFQYILNYLNPANQKVIDQLNQLSN